jgi:hypothetical protein
MSTTRTLRSLEPGPVALTFKSTAADLNVAAEERADAVVTVATEDDEGPSADAVNKAVLRVDGSRLTVEIDEGSGGGLTIVSGRNISVGRNFGVVAGSVHGDVIMTGGRSVTINGVTVSGSGGIQIGGSPIYVRAQVPTGSSVSGRSQSGGLDTTGRLNTVAFSSQSGGTYVDEANSVNVNSQSGSHHVTTLTGSGNLNTMSGNVDVHGPASASANASTMSGNVTFTGGIRGEGSSMSGRVRNR